MLEIGWKSFGSRWPCSEVQLRLTSGVIGKSLAIFRSCWEIFANLLCGSLLNQVCMWFYWLSSDIFSLLSKKRSYSDHSMYFFFLFICRKSTRWLANNCLQIMAWSCVLSKFYAANNILLLRNCNHTLGVKQLLHSVREKYRHLSDALIS